MQFINTARIPTAQRVSTLEAEAETLRIQLAEAARRKPARSGGAAAEEEEDDDGDEAEAAVRQREQQELKSAPNPINEYVEMLEEEVCFMPPLPHLQRTRFQQTCHAFCHFGANKRQFYHRKSAHNSEILTVLPCIAMI